MKVDPWVRTHEANYPRQPTAEEKNKKPETDIEQGWTDPTEPEEGRPTLNDNWSNNRPMDY